MSNVTDIGTDQAEVRQRSDTLITTPPQVPQPWRPKYPVIDGRHCLEHDLWFVLKDPWEVSKADTDAMEIGALPALLAMDTQKMAAIAKFEAEGGNINPNDLTSLKGLLAIMGDMSTMEPVIKAGIAMQDAVCVGWLKCWGRDSADPTATEPLPTVGDIRQVMPAMLYDALAEATTHRDDLLKVDFSVDGAMDPKAGTGRSKAFSAPGKATGSRPSRKR